MDCYDISGDGGLDLLIGRQDGIIEVYSFNNETEEGNAVLRYSYVNIMRNIFIVFWCNNYIIHWILYFRLVMKV